MVRILSIITRLSRVTLQKTNTDGTRVLRISPSHTSLLPKSLLLIRRSSWSSAIEEEPKETVEGRTPQDAEKTLKPPLVPQHITTQTPLHVASLPPLPARPTTWPTPWLSLSEMQEYLVPLQELLPLKALPTSSIKKKLWWNRPAPVLDLSGVEAKTSALRLDPGNGLHFIMTYTFTDVECANEFVAEVKRIARVEKVTPTLPLYIMIPYVDLPMQHDPGYMHVYHHSDSKQGDDSFTTIEKIPYVARVNLRITTHQAYIPKEISDLRPTVPARDVTPFPEDLIIPGVTMRDVRFAMLVDQVFREQFLIVFADSENGDKSENQNQNQNEGENKSEIFNKARKRTGLPSFIRPLATPSGSLAYPNPTLSPKVGWQEGCFGRESKKEGKNGKIESKKRGERQEKKEKKETKENKEKKRKGTKEKKTRESKVIRNE
ncbi:hypothetical protein EV368DRAFT_67179 [Lentinula lateritia]|nr:hypothetical protein EV368DRAFT_67179 [Lentinula lateritia]